MEEHGGKRPRAGRKKGSLASHTLEAQEIRNYLVQEVIRERKPIIRALINKAKTGDTSAIREILDRTLGKVTELFDIKAGSTFQELKKIQDYQRKIIEMSKSKKNKDMV